MNSTSSPSHEITSPIDRADLMVPAPEQVPKPVDVQVHGAIRGFRVPFPGLVHQLLAGQHPTLVPDQRMQDLETTVRHAKGALPSSYPNGHRQVRRVESQVPAVN